MELFDDVDEDGIEVDESASDRVLFAAIATRREIGDLPVAEAWAILGERYPDDARLRILALAWDLDAHGAVDDPDALTRALDVLSAQIGDATREAYGALLASVEGAAEGDREIAAATSRLRQKTEAPPMNEAKARRILRAFQRTLLAEADEKTRDGAPFAERRPTTPNDAALVAAATGPAKKYAPTASFDVGDRVDHAKFGVGVVVSKAEGKIEVAFPDQRRRFVAQ